MKPLSIIILSVLFIGTIIFGIHIETGSGKQVGYVSAVEKSGIFFKTYTAYIKPSLESTQEDTYCVLDPQIVEVLEAMSRLNEKVEVSHISWLISGTKNCAGEDAVITKAIWIKTNPY